MLVEVWLSCCQGERGSDYYHLAREGKGGRVTFWKAKKFHQFHNFSIVSLVSWEKHWVARLRGTKLFSSEVCANHVTLFSPSSLQ